MKRVTTSKRGMPPFTITPRVSLAPERVGPVVELTPLEVMAPCVAGLRGGTMRPGWEQNSSNYWGHCVYHNDGLRAVGKAWGGGNLWFGYWWYDASRPKGKREGWMPTRWLAQWKCEP